ncbi:hypothetical protein HMPREF9103_01466 [Lentilactobacillus parafarraginis F0439]|uniref:Uncharacterized protein n=1 Tax=Lentilactobacillus parafarraginis F0439 TaxID=797515 RepID=G9ZP12_9LACO|nr:hypothetical protein HMPREF9103_01466 [Lentilactobacillus parafarraginis F0439]
MKIITTTFLSRFSLLTFYNRSLSHDAGTSSPLIFFWQFKHEKRLAETTSRFSQTTNLIF